MPQYGDRSEGKGTARTISKQFLYLAGLHWWLESLGRRSMFNNYLMSTFLNVVLVDTAYASVDSDPQKLKHNNYFCISSCLQCFTGFTFLVPAHPGSSRKGRLNRCMCVCIIGIKKGKILSATAK